MIEPATVRSRRVALGARCLLGAAAGGVLCLAFPTPGWWWTAALALAGHTWLIVGRGGRHGALIGLCFGAGFFLPVLSWSGIFVGPGPWIALATLQALFLAAQSAVIGAVSRRFRSRQGPAPLSGLVLLIAGTWVTQEYLRGRLPFGGFPWARLAFSQSNSPFAPVAAIGGMPLLTFTVAALGAALGLALGRGRWPTKEAQRLPRWSGRRRALLVAATVLVLGLGAPRAVLPRLSGPSISAAAIQGNVPTAGLDFNAQRRAVLDNHAQLTQTAADEIARGQRPAPDIVIWPENASDLDPFRNLDARLVINEAVRSIGAPTLVGAVLQRPDGRLSNASIVWEDLGPGQQYLKRHPVPFGEYIPYRKFFRLFSDKVDLVRADFAPGTQSGVLRLGPARAGVGICFEVAYDDIIRDTITGGADLLVIQTNNATFGESDESSQQLAMSRLRAIEHGRSLVHVSTVGQSALIAPDGKIHQQSGLLSSAVLQADLPLITRKTLASRWGEALEVLLIALNLLACLLIARPPRWPSRPRARRAGVQFPGD
ncbi:MAG: apolipoprotein N-acyltransferase [Angustibacter sp.]